MKLVHSAYTLSPEDSSSSGGCCNYGFLHVVRPCPVVQCRQVSWVQQPLEPTQLTLEQYQLLLTNVLFSFAQEAFVASGCL